MGVLFQAFYWNCPSEENQDGAWWNFLTGKIPELQQAGFTALWLPPACKAANLGGPSMGYDPYDYFDLGDFNQKGRIKTWFGNQAELVSLISAAHTANMQVYADLVRPGQAWLMPYHFSHSATSLILKSAAKSITRTPE